MGDIVQTLPALTDAAKSIPNIRFDWALDEEFAQIAAWHPAVETLIPTALRRLRRSFRQGLKDREINSILKKLRSVKYDFVVDLQGILKSAMIARLAKGVRCGFDSKSIHESGAQVAYKKRFRVTREQHAIRRMRELLSKSLGYSFNEDEIDYGIDKTRLQRAPLELPKPFLTFIHSTSWASKCWHETYWKELTKRATEAGLFVVLPWGDEAERLRSERIAAGIDKAFVLPKLSIAEKASIIAQSAGTVGLDTGLSHIAAMLGVPSVTIYGATDPLLVGAKGENQMHMASNFECVKCHQTECTYTTPEELKPACLVEFTPEKVWINLQELLRVTNR
jgi:heptosyltransferase-1